MDHSGYQIALFGVAIVFIIGFFAGGFVSRRSVNRRSLKGKQRVAEREEPGGGDAPPGDDETPAT